VREGTFWDQLKPEAVKGYAERYLLFRLESIEVFAKAQISDQIKRREVEPPNNVHLAFGRPIDLIVELLDK
jgi:hypothetical protein